MCTGRDRGWGVWTRGRGRGEDESVDEGGDEASFNSTEDDASSTDQLVQVDYFTLFNRYSFLLIL